MQTHGICRPDNAGDDTLFVLMLPLFFVVPLALFSLKAILLPHDAGIGLSPALTPVPSILYLFFGGLAMTAVFRQKNRLMWTAYFCLVTGTLLQVFTLMG